MFIFFRKQRYIDELERQIVHLNEAVTHQKEVNDDLEGQIGHLRNDIKNQRKVNGDLERQISHLQEDIKNQREVNGDLERQIVHLNEAVTHQKEVNNRLEGELIHEKETYNRLLELQSKEKYQIQRKLKMKDKVITQIENELNKSERDLKDARCENQLLKQKLDNKIDLDYVISALLPNLEFVRYSVSSMLNELTNPKVLLRKLHQLNNDHSQLKSEHVNSTKNWWKVNFNTGDGTDGRLYYKLALNGKYQVLLSYKEKQKKDISYLTKMD